MDIMLPFWLTIKACILRLLIGLIDYKKHPDKNLGTKSGSCKACSQEIDTIYQETDRLGLI